MIPYIVLHQHRGRTVAIYEYSGSSVHSEPFNTLLIKLRFRIVSDKKAQPIGRVSNPFVLKEKDTVGFLGENPHRDREACREFEGWDGEIAYPFEFTICTLSAIV